MYCHDLHDTIRCYLTKETSIHGLRVGIAMFCIFFIWALPIYQGNRITPIESQLTCHQMLLDTRIYMGTWGFQQFLRYLITSCIKGDRATPYNHDLHTIKYATWHQKHGIMVFTNSLLFYVRELLCKFQLFWSWGSWKEDFQIFFFLNKHISFPFVAPPNPRGHDFIKLVFVLCWKAVLMQISVVFAQWFLRRIIKYTCICPI
jgi:hypothetical protein